MMTDPCPICAEWHYISLVKVCPICGSPGKLQEVSDTAEEYLRRLEFKRIWGTETFEELWNSIKPAATDPGHCPLCEKAP
jgi:hypothetical protein